MSGEPAWLRAFSKTITGRENLSIVIALTSILGLIGHLLFIPLFLWLDVKPMVFFNVGSCFLFLFCYFINRGGHTYWALGLGALEIVVHAVAAVAFLGWESGFGLYILGLSPLVFYSQRWRLSFKVWLTTALCIVNTALFVVAMNVEPWSPVGRFQLTLTGMLNSVVVFVIFATLAYVFRLAATTTESVLTEANLALEQQANTDPLTGLANRRLMQEMLDQSIAAYQSTGATFCVVIGDIDDFKAFNDFHGHEAGDAVLITVADTMRASLRDQDRVARWGGEEFLILLTGTHLADAKYAAQRLLAQVAARHVEVEGRSAAVTMTMGVAEFEGEADTSACIKRADAALYIGKHTGKNQVVTLMDLLRTEPAERVDDSADVVPDEPARVLLEHPSHS